MIARWLLRTIHSPKAFLGCIAAVGLLIGVACGPGAAPTPTATPTKAPTVAPTPTPALIATPTPTKAPAIAPTPTPTLIATPTPTKVPTPVRYPGKYGGTLRVGQTTKGEELFYVVNSGGGQHEWGEPLANALLAYGPDSEWDKDRSLVESYVLSSDFTTVTLKLRTGVKFHDGTDFNAAAVKHNLEWVLNPLNAVAFRPQLEAIDRVTVIDPYTVEIHLSRVHSAIITNLGLRSTYAFSPTAFEKPGGKAAFNTKPVGTGPFMAKEYVPGSYVLYEKNPNYWDKGLPYLDAIRWEEIIDDRVRAGALQTGQLDLITAMPAGATDAIKAVRSIPGVQELRSFGGPSYDHFNAARAPFNDKRVRIALQMAMDRDAWNKVINNNEGVPYSGGMHTPGHAATYTVPEAQFPYPYDPARAKALIEEYAREKGLKLPLATMGGWQPTPEQAARGAVALEEGQPIVMIAIQTATNMNRAELSKAYYEAIGFKITVLLGGGDEEKKTFVWKNAGFSLRGVGTRPHPSGSMDSYMGYGGYWNMGGWGTSPEQMEVDRLLKLAATTFDLVEQNRLYQQAQKIWMEEALGGVKTAHAATSRFAPPYVKLDKDIKKWLNYPSDNVSHVSFLWLDR